MGMMIVATINDHKMLVPNLEGLKVVLETGFPGAYDHIDYRGYEICTIDDPKVDADGYYADICYACDPDGDIVECESLWKAIKFIETNTEKFE